MNDPEQSRRESPANRMPPRVICEAETNWMVDVARAAIGQAACD